MPEYNIPPIYNPPLSDEVIACAQLIASEALARFEGEWDDTPALYQHVRAVMGRRAYVNVDCPTLDDESISEGIIRALNAA